MYSGERKIVIVSAIFLFILLPPKEEKEQHYWCFYSYLVKNVRVCRRESRLYTKSYTVQI